MKLSKILFGILLAFSFTGCDDFSLTDVLNGVTLTIVNETESIYRVNVEGVEGIYYLESNEDYNTIEIQVFYDYNNFDRTHQWTKHEET